MKIPVKTKYALSLLVATLFWGVTFPAMKISTVFSEPAPMICARYLLAGAALLIYARRRLGGLSRRLLFRGAVLGLILFVAMLLQVEGLKRTSAVNSSLLTSIYTLLVPCMAALIFRRKPRRQTVTGLFAAAAGLFFVCGVLSFRAEGFPVYFLMTPLNHGDALAVLSSAALAAYIITSTCFVTDGSDPVLLNTLQMLFCGAFAGLLWAFNPAWKADFSSPLMIAILVFCGIFAGALSYMLMLNAQRHLDATRIALIFSTEPMFGAAFSLIIPDLSGRVESMSVSALFGGILILSGILYSELSDTKSP